jgi:hypothetical protein
MPIVATRGNAGAFAYGLTAGGAPEVLGGMVLMTPTSVDKTGTGSTATIGTNGSVTFSSCTTVSLNGVFNTDYDNYMLVCWFKGVAGDGVNLSTRFRASGSDNSSSSYTHQYLAANGTTVAGSRNTSQTSVDNHGYSAGSTRPAGIVMYLYGPWLAQPTAGREIEIRTFADASINDNAFTFSGSNQFDGLTFIDSTASNMSGLVSVYGLVGT